MQTKRTVRSSRHFDVWNEVPLVPQTSSMSCWAAAAAMIVGWRERRPVDPGYIAEGLGMWAAYRDGLRPRDVDELARVWGLVQETRGEWTLAALHQLLEEYGPVWMGEASPGLHSVVVTGMIQLSVDADDVASSFGPLPRSDPEGLSQERAPRGSDVACDDRKRIRADGAIPRWCRRSLAIHARGGAHLWPHR